MIFNLALQYVQNTSDAEEITQDVFVTVHQRMDSFKGDSTISTWVYRIGVNKCLDFIKAKKRAKRFAFVTSLYRDDTMELAHDPPDFDHPGVLLENREDLQRLFGFINQLPDNQRTALILHKIEDQSQSDVAEIMGITVKAVESLVQRAKANLLKKIHEVNEG
ncbi:MAG: RNA polymerase sigma factor [Ignavibacteria bacterium]|nr:RNA polymerase sigma factor [Ignavibacteria bacterium]